MSEDPILAALADLKVGQTTLRVDLMARMDSLETGQARLRVDLMERMDRLQNRMDSFDEHLSMGLGNSDRVERKSDGVAEQNRILGEQLNILHKIVRQLEGRINGLEERK